MKKNRISGTILDYERDQLVIAAVFLIVVLLVRVFFGNFFRSLYEYYEVWNKLTASWWNLPL